MIERAYVSSRYGQVHLRRLAAVDSKAPTLVCLHPAPSSGLWFETVMPLLNGQRDVIAPDYPGYGGSDRPADSPTIADYAAAMIDVIRSLDAPVDLLGFHTGCLVGAEIALQAPDLVRKLLLCDVPTFGTEQRAALGKKMAAPMGLTAELDSLEAVWAFNITSRVPEVPMPRAVELLAEHLRAGEAAPLAFAAAFDYDWQPRFAQLEGEVHVLATQGGLHATSVAAAEAISDAQFVDVTEVTSAVFETGADAISKRILLALDT